MAQALSKNDGILFMEFARFGDLVRMLDKAAGADPGAPLFVPIQAAWRFFDCLVKGCMAMDYPPRLLPANFPADAPPGTTRAPTDGGYLPEIVPPGALNGNVPGHEGIVHFDLDPNNGMNHSLYPIDDHQAMALTCL